jgi:isoaspartyl peptidase/L-asparaginase-like protein (Ntn-hydrolase superfamily)
MSPTQLTLRHLRNDGYTAEVVERWNPHARIRNDLFGFIDVVALKGDETLGVQTTTAGHVNDRCRKIAESPMVGIVREAGWTLHVHGWQKIGNRWVLHKLIDVS